MKIYLNIALLLIYLALFPFLFIGIINRVKAIWCGRKGQSLLQPLYDCIRLLRKEEVISTVTSYVFILAPVVTVSVVLFAALVVPGPTGRSLVHFSGDYIFFAYLLSFSKFASSLGAMDTGSSFEGMGAARDLSFTSMVEPAYMIVATTIVYATGYLSFQDMLTVIHSSKGWSVIAWIPIVVALVIMVLAEGKRVPVDDPKTHLELTMIHEVMILDNSGISLALANYASALKICVISSIIAAVSIPQQWNGLRYLGLFLFIMILMAVLIGIIESISARVRMSNVPQFVFTMISVSLLVLAVLFLKVFGGIL